MPAAATGYSHGYLWDTDTVDCGLSDAFPRAGFSLCSGSCFDDGQVLLPGEDSLCGSGAGGGGVGGGGSCSRRLPSLCGSGSGSATGTGIGDGGDFFTKEGAIRL